MGKWWGTQILLLIFFPGLIPGEKRGVPTDVVYGWKTIEFDYKSSTHRQELIDQQKFIPSHVGIAGIKIHVNRMFLSVPRYLAGTPVTLTEVPYTVHPSNPLDPPQSPSLKPFPSWEMQEIGNCSALQFVQAMEIDAFNRMWVMDAGKSDVLMPTIVTGCPAKIVIFDLNDHDRIVHSYDFPDATISLQNGVVIEIVVGCHTPIDCWAYMADILSERIVIYSLRQNKSWTVKHSSMSPEPGNYSVFGKPFNMKLGVDGMALSPLTHNFDTLYYTSLAGYNMYSVSTQFLQNLGHGVTNEGATFNLSDSHVTKVGKRFSLCDGFTMDANGRLFMGANEHNSIHWWDSFTKWRPFSQEFLTRNDEDLNWSDALTFDQRGNLVITTTKFNEAPNLDRNLISFKVVRVFVGAHQYSYLPCNGGGLMCNPYYASFDK